jgi:hypothetical protein
MIKYIFRFEDGCEKTFDIDFDNITPIPETIPEWMLLDNNKCRNCPLLSSQTKICPAALEAGPVIEAFQKTFSYENVFVRVETPERNYEKNIDAQNGLMAILGLLMSKSSCPHFKNLRVLGIFHLPFASSQESFFRVVSMFSIRHYFAQDEEEGPGLKIDFNELTKFYENLQVLNYDFLQRVRLASKKDANLNAIVGLHSLSSKVASSIDEQLEFLKTQFKA